MAADSPLHLLLFWHQHQPLYKDGLKNRYEMPWVRLHATKDYFDMVAVLEEFPTVKANFNLVPSLLSQLDDYAEHRAQDRFLDITVKPAKELTFDDRQFLLENFFMAHWEHMVDPYPRYRELLEKRGRQVSPDTFSRTQTYFNEQDWRDLQTWFNLTWFDPWWREQDPFINGLFEKGKQFTESDKQRLVAKQIEICGMIVAKHKALQDKGQIEVTTTPFYHPILPLLCDSDIARTALPNATLPAPKFRHPEDAHVQLKRAVDDYTRRFGTPPQGLWPSEGSVSEEALQLILRAGIRWVATDEAVLQNSLSGAGYRREDLFQPYRYCHEGQDLYLYFRDHELSDAIGFVYASWDPEIAAKDFLKRLHQRKKSLQDLPGPHVVSVVLDGENCWEYYAKDGLPFLRALYRELAQDPDIVTVRGSDFINTTATAPVLKAVWPGSWINGNFAIWIGHSEDNTAWSLLLKTRQYLTESIRSNPDLQQHPQIQEAWEEIYIAEGSDWCWWYGEDHSSANDGAFDYLFRKHLMNVYTLIGGKIPDELHIPIKRKKKSTPILEPVDFITPTLDGRVTGYFEWRAAGIYHTETGGTGTMQKSENFVKSIYYGFDQKKIYFRIDFDKKVTPETWGKLKVRIACHGKDKRDVELGLNAEGIIATYLGSASAGPQVCGQFKKVLEIGLDLEKLSPIEDSGLDVHFVILLDGQELERWPSESKIKIPNPSSATFAYNWQV